MSLGTDKINVGHWTTTGSVPFQGKNRISTWSTPSPHSRRLQGRFRGLYLYTVDSVGRTTGPGPDPTKVPERHLVLLGSGAVVGPGGPCGG